VKHVANYREGQRVWHLVYHRVGTVVEVKGVTSPYAITVEWDDNTAPKCSSYTKSYAAMRIMPLPVAEGLAPRRKRRMRI
jgi:hypothetical protein